jgi:predicted enzyme related to lactoylglutathione lyase
MPITGVSSICHMVSDWERAKRFYGEALGLTLVSCSDETGWAAYSVGDQGPPFFLVRQPEVAGKGGNVILGFSVSQAAELLVRLQAAGGTLSETVQEGPDVRIFTVYDPDGNAFELSEALPSPNGH